MTEQEKIALLTTAKDLFRNSFATNHYRNTEGLDKISKFNINPFLHKYLTMFAFGEDTPMNRRNAPEFKSYFNLIWKELNQDEKSS